MATKKIPAGFIAMFFIVSLILCQGFADAHAHANANAKVQVQVQQAHVHSDSEMPHVGEFTPGMPLYRSRSDPDVLIPEYKIESLKIEIG